MNAILHCHLFWRSTGLKGLQLSAAYPSDASLLFQLLSAWLHFFVDGEEDFDEAASDLLGDEADGSENGDGVDEDWDLEDEEIA